MEEENGIAIIAYNNSQLNYLQFAAITSAYVKLHMKNNKVALITDTGTEDWMNISMPKDHVDLLFDYVISHEVHHDPNPRRHFDSPWTEFTTQFSNKNKDNIFELTPFEKTLLIDSDYFICNNFYDRVFESGLPLGLHRDAIYLEGQPPYLNEIDLNEAGIHHWWSTAVYFDKSEESKIFFGIWEHVKENWDYYALLYQFPPGLFRTDFCVSIAIHILNGFTNEHHVYDFDGVPLINMDQKDDLIRVKDFTDMTFLSHNRSEPWKNIMVRKQNENLHIMNKRAMARQSDKMYEDLITALKEKQ